MLRRSLRDALQGALRRTLRRTLWRTVSTLPLLAAAALASSSAAKAPASAASARRLPPPVASDWQPLRFRNIARTTRYEAVDADGSRAARAESDCAASALVLPLLGLDLASTPRLRWRWRIERPLPEHAERDEAGDDFAARVYVMFRFDPSQASWWERARQRLARGLYGDTAPGRALSYVWTTREPAGAEWPSPYTRSSRMISQGRGALPEWRTEEVEPGADYRRLFGSEPTEATALGIMTDADNLCASTVAWFADFEWVAPGGTPGAHGPAR